MISLKSRLGTASLRQRVLDRGMRQVAEKPYGSRRIYRDLTYGWGNAAWAAPGVFLRATMAAAKLSSGAVLECGSGLTTLLLANHARIFGREVLSLEHDQAWLSKVVEALFRYRLDAVVRRVPLVDYGEFNWYDVNPAGFPSFGLVVCDGPPGTTRGGRFGLLPVMWDRLQDGCMILLDDAERDGEQEVLERWEDEFGVSYEIREDERPYAVCRVRK